MNNPRTDQVSKEPARVGDDGNGNLRRLQLTFLGQMHPTRTAELHPDHTTLPASSTFILSIFGATTATMTCFFFVFSRTKADGEGGGGGV